MKINCWEFHRCGQEPGGAEVVKFGVCPAVISKEYHGKNGGVNSGRYCWRISGTLCDILTKKNRAEKILKCVACAFYKRVQDEQGSSIEM